MRPHKVSTTGIYSPKILVVFLFTTLLFVIFYAQIQYQRSQVKSSLDQKQISEGSSSKPTSSPDARSCILGEIPNTFDKEYFIGKTFENFSASGETGTLNSDYRLPLKWGRDWNGPNDTRPNSGVGGWSIEDYNNNFRMVLVRTSLSDGTYGDFKFYQYKQNTFAIPIGYIGLIIGSNQDTIEDFYNNQIIQCF